MSVSEAKKLGLNPKAIHKLGRFHIDGDLDIINDVVHINGREIPGANSQNFAKNVVVNGNFTIQLNNTVCDGDIVLGETK